METWSLDDPRKRSVAVQILMGVLALAGYRERQ